MATLGDKKRLIWENGAMLQIRRRFKDNLGLIFHISPLKHMFATHHYNHLLETVLMRGHNIYFH